MAATVKEIMNPELFEVAPSDPVVRALDGILGFGITGAPVVDGEHRPVGVVALRDLVDAGSGARVADRMTTPALVIRDSARVNEAARLIGETGCRRLVVVDAAGRAVGMVSAVDVIRALVGLPVQHPAAFPHMDRRSGLQWSDAAAMDDRAIEAAPDAPGIIELVHDAPGQRARVVWIEGARSIRSRLLDMLTLPQAHWELTRWLEEPAELCFRYAMVADAAARDGVIEDIRGHSLPQLSPRAIG